MRAVRACAGLLAGLALACGGSDSGAAPAGSWLDEPLSAVRLSELDAGPVDSLPPLDNPYDKDQTALVQGRQIYQAFNCGGCHGGQGGGGIGPPLADAEWIYGGSAANIYASVVQGRPNGMPAYGPALQGEAVWKLAAFVRSLSEHEGGKEAEQGRAAEDREGQDRESDR